MATPVARETHIHGKDCGHQRVQHDGHIDYIENGHLYHPTSTQQNEDHRIEISPVNPSSGAKIACTETMIHGRNAPRIPHGDHFDYVVDGRLHHVNGSQCEDHGPIELVH